MALTPQEEMELAALEAEFSKTPNRSFSSMGLTADEEAELAQLEAEFSQAQSPGLMSQIGQGAINALTTAGEFVDSYTGAPTRAAIGAMVTGNNPLTAFADQFGEDTSYAPTGKEIYQASGLPDFNIIDDPLAKQDAELRAQGFTVPETENAGLTMSGVAGLGVDLVADPLNFLAIGPVAKSVVKGAGKAAKGASKLALKGSVAATDAALGTKAISESVETASKYLDRVIESTKSSFNPKRADDFDDFATIAKNNGIDPDILPETVEFGTHSTITKKAKTLAEGPGGENIQKRFTEAQGAVEGALDSQIAKIGGGVKYSDADAGKKLVESYNNGIKSFFDQDMITHSKVINANPGMILNQDALKSVQSKVKGLKNKATGRLRRGIGDQQDQAKQLLKDIDVIERSLDKAGNLSYKRASELLSNIGEEAFKKNPAGSKTPIDQKALQDLYFTLRDAMYESAGHVLGPDAATELAMNNEIISQFLKEKGRVSKIFEGDLAPEKLFKRIVESGDTDQINALKEIMSPDDFKTFKGAYLNKIVAKGADGSPLYKTTLKNLEKRKDALSIAFQPNEIKEFSDVLRLGDRVGDFIFNTSNTNTAARFAPKEWVSNIVSGAVDEVTLERLKDVARGKAKAITVPFTTSGGTTTKATVTPKTAQAVLRQLPILNSSSRQIIKGGEMASIQNTNQEIERRKRAISGGNP